MPKKAEKPAPKGKGRTASRGRGHAQAAEKRAEQSRQAQQPSKEQLEQMKAKKEAEELRAEFVAETSSNTMYIQGVMYDDAIRLFGGARNQVDLLNAAKICYRQTGSIMIAVGRLCEMVPLFSQMPDAWWAAFETWLEEEGEDIDFDLPGEDPVEEDEEDEEEVVH